MSNLSIFVISKLPAVLICTFSFIGSNAGAGWVCGDKETVTNIEA